MLTYELGNILDRRRGCFGSLVAVHHKISRR